MFSYFNEYGGSATEYATSNAKQTRRTFYRVYHRDSSNWYAGDRKGFKDNGMDINRMKANPSYDVHIVSGR